MDAASQRGIDDIREIRERVVLQPAEGRYKVYILDEAHQLTDAAWNALLKLIEEPPPHLVFVFCTTELAEGAADRALALPDVRLPAPAAARSSCAYCAASRRRGDRGARRCARADRAQLARLVPRRGVDARPARGRDRQYDHRAGRPPAARRRRGGVALPALRHDRRPRHGRRARSDRGARRAGAGSRAARHRPARASPPPAARPAHGRRARFAARHRRDARAAARAGEPAAASRPSSGSDRPARGRPWTTCARAATRGCRSSSRS